VSGTDLDKGAIGVSGHGTLTNDGVLGILGSGTLAGSVVDNSLLEFLENQNATCAANISGGSNAQIVNNSTTNALALTGNLDNFFGQIVENPGLIIT